MSAAWKFIPSTPTCRNLPPASERARLWQPGEKIAVMGRTSNTRSGISRDRAHVHFELNLFYNDHFSGWYKKHYPKEHDDHGIWNGQNLVGFDPRLILLAEREEGPQFQPRQLAAASHRDLPRAGAEDRFFLAQALSHAGAKRPGHGRGSQSPVTRSRLISMDFPLS